MKYLLIFFLMALALIERLFIDLGPNVELVTLVTFIAGFYLGKKFSLIIPLLVLAISDIFLGNTNVMLFTWSGYLVIGSWAVFINKLTCHFEGVSTTEKSSRNAVLRFETHRLVHLFARFLSANWRIEMTKSIKKIIFATFGGAIASLWFYLWTNFGVWFLDSWGTYPKTLNGLLVCYINGLPFLKNQFFSNLVIIPAGFLAIELWLYMKNLAVYKKHLSPKNLIVLKSRP